MVLQVHITTGQVLQEWSIILSMQFLPKMGSTFEALGTPPGCSLASHVPVYRKHRRISHTRRYAAPRVWQLIFWKTFLERN